MRWPLILISIFLVLSCGTRKSSLEVSKSNVDLKKSSFEENKIKNDIETKAAVSNFNLFWENETLKNSNAEIDVEETFDKDGKLIGRKTKAKFNNSELKKEKAGVAKTDSTRTKTDKSKSSTKKGEDLKLKRSDKDKAKKTDADKTVAKNVGGPGWLYGIIISIVIILFIYFWLRKPVIKEKKE